MGRKQKKKSEQTVPTTASASDPNKAPKCPQCVYDPDGKRLYLCLWCAWLPDVPEEATPCKIQPKKPGTF